MVMVEETADDAGKAIRRAGCRTGRVAAANSNRFAKRRVISQSLRAEEPSRKTKVNSSSLAGAGSRFDPCPAHLEPPANRGVP
jgi:hypothetical protein